MPPQVFVSVAQPPWPRWSGVANVNGGGPQSEATPDAAADAAASSRRSFRELRAARDKSGSARLIDAMHYVEPTWIEGIAVVQAVCAQLDPGETPPAIGDIVLSASGTVSFPLGGIVMADVAIQAVGRLLTGFLRAGGCPLSVWEASERADRSPMSFGSVRGFGAALTILPAHRGPEQLAALVRQLRDLAPGTPRLRTPAGRASAGSRAFLW